MLQHVVFELFHLCIVKNQGTCIQDQCHLNTKSPCVHKPDIYNVARFKKHWKKYNFYNCEEMCKI